MKNSFYIMKLTSWLYVTYLLIAATINNNAYGNAVALSTIVVDQTASTVTYTITWQNSWRIAAGTAPYNWDAVWVFVKFRDCSAPTTTTQFTHGTVSTVLANHNFDVNGDGAQVESTTCGGIGTATITAPGIDADGMGVMLRRTSVGAGTVTETVRLNVTNLPASGTLDVRVFAIEMVFCEGGTTSGQNHYIGDGNGATAANSSFTTTSGGSNAIQITSENAITVNYFSGGAGSALTASFQKGWNPFYIMKYEISQGQYVDFLNTLHDNGANNRYPGSYNSYRHRINQPGNPAPQVYTCDRPDRACNFLGWADVSAYLDWAALRPLTELEYEKAGRGFNAKQLAEFAWGNTTITGAAAGGISPNADENGTEVISTANANVCAGFISYNTGDGRAGGVSQNQSGPLRCGIFAQAATNRTQSGSGYFGAMELTGNILEYYVGANCGVAGQPSNAGVLWGDGALDANANHNTASWPPYNNATATNLIRRGGNWTVSTSAVTLQLSDRSGANTLIRDMTIGGRGGR